MNRMIHTTTAVIFAAGLCVGLAACEDTTNENTPPRDTTTDTHGGTGANNNPATNSPTRTPADTDNHLNGTNNTSNPNNPNPTNPDVRPDSPAPDRPATPNGGAMAPNAGATNPDVRILSILHAKNQEEIAAGRLAQEKGASDAVKQYGKMLVDDHTASDEKVKAAASAAGITLMDPAQTKQMLAREKNKPASDPIAELSGLSGDAFDKAFAQKMHMGHSELIQMVEDAQDDVTNDNVKRLLTETLPTLRTHEQHASELPA